jgi:Astacin (Peptidase family M12A)
MAYSILFFLCIILPLLNLVHAQNNTETALFTLPPGVNVTTVHILDAHGERNISYYVANGYAIVDGDVAYGTVAELLSKVVPDSGNNGNITGRSFPRAFSILQSGPKWPGAIVKYKYDSASTQSKVSGFIDTAISRWQAMNPFLQFTQVSAPSPNAVAGVVTITAADCSGCYASVIGYSSSANLVVNLQQKCGSSFAGCFENEATHELGHVLGLVHEVKRPDRDQHVIFSCNNLVDFATYPSVSCCGPTSCCGLACQFNIDNSATLDHSGPYRTTSIMQYRADAFAKSGTVTLEGIPPEVVPVSNPAMPDIVDYQRICKIYNQQCPPPPSPCPTCNPTSGLNKCDITTSCITTSPGNNHCACRAGYRANAPGSQTAVQFRLPFPGQEYRVFVAPGVVCDTLCDNPFGAPDSICNEVQLLTQCH